MLARGHNGITNMHDAEKARHQIPLFEMMKVTQGIRNVVGDDIYITVGIPGGFTEIFPILLEDEDFLSMSLAGADGLHIHKSSLEDLEDIVNYSHKYGLLVDAYIGYTEDFHTFGINAKTPEEVSKVAKSMENIGVDFIGLMTGMSYEGINSKKDIHSFMKERIEALVSSVNVPTLAEGGINLDNYEAFKKLGINILVIGTYIDNLVYSATKDIIKKLLN